MIEESILWDELRKQNQRVFDAFFREYYPILVKFAEGFLFDRAMSEDVVQSFFISLWEKPSNIALHGTVKQYCFRSVKNRCLNELRNKRVHDRLDLLYLEAISKQADETPSLIEPQVLDMVKECIEKLPLQMSVIFKLKYLEKKKTSDISQMLNISENTIKTQLSRAKAKIRAMAKLGPFILEFLLNTSF